MVYCLIPRILNLSYTDETVESDTGLKTRYTFTNTGELPITEKYVKIPIRIVMGSSGKVHSMNLVDSNLVYGVSYEVSEANRDITIKFSRLDKGGSFSFEIVHDITRTLFPTYDIAVFKYMNSIGFDREDGFIAVSSCVVFALVLLILKTNGVFKKKKIEKNSSTASSEFDKYLKQKISGASTKIKQGEGTNEQRSSENTIASFDIKANADINILGQMERNNNESREYFSISKNQSRISFWVSVICCFLGVLIFLIAILLSAVFQKIQESVIALVGGAITELIAGTVLWVHNRSALQLKQFYDALHENERFLSSVNLVGKLSISKQDEVFISIINRQMELNDISREQSHVADKPTTTNSTSPQTARSNTKQKATETS